MSSVRTGALEVTTRCSRCGQGVPLSGTEWTARCPHCDAEERISASDWRQTLGWADELLAKSGHGARKSQSFGGAGGGRSITVSTTRGEPPCPRCETPLPEVDHVPKKEGRTFHCTSCGAAVEVRRVPGKMRNGTNAKIAWRAAEDAGDGAAVKVDEEAARPVHFQCPACTASLELRAGADRVIRCQYCGGDVYLPDALYRRLNPIRKAKPFWVRFDGPTVAERNQQRARAREDRERQKLVEEIRAREAEKEEKADEAAGMLPKAWLGAVAFAIVSLPLVVLAALHLQPAESPIPEVLRSAAHLVPWGALIAWAVVALGVYVLALVWTCRPVAHAGGQDGWLLSVIGVAPLFVLLMPVVGGLLALGKAFIFARGELGPMRTGDARSGHQHYDAVFLSRGEGRPVALVLATAAFAHLVMLLAIAESIRSQV